MSQEYIEQTLRTILDQLHGSENKVNRTKNLTAAEIAQILASQPDEKSQKEHQDTKAESEAGLFQIDMESFDLEMQGVNSHWQLLYYRPINCYRKLVAKFIIFGKRVVRRLLKFLIEPLVEEQTQFNAATVKALNSMRNHHVCQPLRQSLHRPLGHLIRCPRRTQCRGRCNI